MAWMQSGEQALVHSRCCTVGSKWWRRLSFFLCVQYLDFWYLHICFVYLNSILCNFSCTHTWVSNHRTWIKISPWKGNGDSDTTIMSHSANGRFLETSLNNVDLFSDNCKKNPCWNTHARSNPRLNMLVILHIMRFASEHHFFTEILHG